MSTIKTHNTRRTLEAMAKRHREDARTLAKICADVLMDDEEVRDDVMTPLMVTVRHLNSGAMKLEKLASDQGAE